MPSSAERIVEAAKQFADEGKVFANGCSEMVKAAYAAGGITIPSQYNANDILNNSTCVANPEPGDVAGWTGSPHGHVVIFLSDSGDKRYSNCPGLGAATKYNRSMGQALEYRRPL